MAGTNWEDSWTTELVRFTFEKLTPEEITLLRSTLQVQGRGKKNIPSETVIPVALQELPLSHTEQICIDFFPQVNTD